MATRRAGERGGAFVLPLVAILLQSACGTAFIHERTNWLLKGYVNDTVSLYDEQILREMPGRTPVHLAGPEANCNKVIDMLARLDGTLAERQRGSVRQRLRDLADDLAEVARRRS